MRARKQRKVGRLGIGGVAIVAAALLALAFALPAAAETTGLPDVPTTPAVEAPAPTEEVQAGTEEAVPSPAPSPEPPEAQEAPIAADSVAAEPSSIPPPPSQIAEPVVQAAGRDVPLETVRTALNASAGEPVAAVAAPVREALRESLDAVDSYAVEALVPRFAQDLSSPLAAPAEMNGLTPDGRTRGLAGSSGERQALIPESPDVGGFPPVSLAPDPMSFGSVQPLTSATPDGFAGPAESASGPFSGASATGELLVDPATGNLPSNPPADLPSPPSRSPGAAPGSGGSIFVPLAALLALLALAAPATSRRLGEVPVFRPPTPFVCALERPG